MKRIVLEHKDGTMQILGVYPGDTQPVSMLDTNFGPVCLVRAYPRFYLYRPLMLPATMNEFGTTSTFDPRQV